MRLKGQVALVTGGGSGAGQAIVAGLVSEGATVVAVGRDADKLQAACQAVNNAAPAGAAAHAQAGDVTDRERVAAVVDGVVDAHARLDVLVNNAGINIADRSLEALSPADWDRVLQVNATGAFNTIHAALPHMRRQGGGLVIAISSMAGQAPSVLGGAAYAAAKHAMSVVTRMVDLEEARHGIRACVISPGEIDTPILDQRPEPVSQAHRDRILQPEDIAAAVLFVATLPPRVVIPELTIKPLGQGSIP